MNDIKAKLNFSSNQSPLVIRSSYSKVSPPLINRRRITDFHMLRQSPAVLDRMYDRNSVPVNGRLDTSLLYNKMGEVVYSPKLSQMLKTTTTRNKHSPNATSIVQLAAGTTRRHSGAQVNRISPVLIKLTQPQRERVSQQPQQEHAHDEPVTLDPCDKDVVVSALKAKRKRWWGTTNTVTTDSTNPLSKRPRTTAVNAIEVPVSSKRALNTEDMQPVKKAKHASSFAVDRNDRTDRDTTGEDMFITPSIVHTLPGNTDRKRKENNGDTVVEEKKKKKCDTPPVSEETEEDTMKLKLKKEATVKLKDTLTKVYPSPSRGASIRKKAPILCTTGSKPHIMLQENFSVTPEALKRDKAAMTSRVRSLLMSDDPIDEELKLKDKVNALSSSSNATPTLSAMPTTVTTPLPTTSVTITSQPNPALKISLSSKVTPVVTSSLLMPNVTSTGPTMTSSLLMPNITSTGPTMTSSLLMPGITSTGPTMTSSLLMPNIASTGPTMTSSLLMPNITSTGLSNITSIGSIHQPVTSSLLMPNVTKPICLSTGVITTAAQTTLTASISNPITAVDAVPRLNLMNNNLPSVAGSLGGVAMTAVNNVKPLQLTSISQNTMSLSKAKDQLQKVNQPSLGLTNAVLGTSQMQPTLGSNQVKPPLNTNQIQPSLGLTNQMQPQSSLGLTNQMQGTNQLQPSLGLTNQMQPSLGLTNQQPSLGLTNQMQGTNQIQPSLGLTNQMQGTNQLQPSLGLTNQMQPSLGLTNQMQPSLGLTNQMQPSLGLTNQMKGTNQLQPSLGLSNQMQGTNQMQPTLGLTNSFSLGINQMQSSTQSLGSTNQIQPTLGGVNQPNKSLGTNQMQLTLGNNQPSLGLINQGLTNQMQPTLGLTNQMQLTTQKNLFDQTNTTSLNSNNMKPTQPSITNPNPQFSLSKNTSFGFTSNTTTSTISTNSQSLSFGAGLFNQQQSKLSTSSTSLTSQSSSTLKTSFNFSLSSSKNATLGSGTSLASTKATATFQIGQQQLSANTAASRSNSGFGILGGNSQQSNPSAGNPSFSFSLGNQSTNQNPSNPFNFNSQNIQPNSLSNQQRATSNQTSLFQFGGNNSTFAAQPNPFQSMSAPTSAGNMTTPNRQFSLGAGGKTRPTIQARRRGNKKT